MIDFQLFVVETVQDALFVESTGAVKFPINETECDNCGLLTGPVAFDFFPCVVAVCTSSTNAPEHLVDSPTLLCLDCVSPVLYPGELGQ